MNIDELNKNNVDNGPVKEILLENKEEGHYKFYILSKKKDSTDTWLAKWGKIGTRPQQKVYRYDKVTPYNQMMAKLKKGYKVVKYQTFNINLDDTISESLEYLKSIGIDVDTLDDILY